MSIALDHLDNAQIDVWTQPSVQADLLGAISSTLSPRGKVHEAQIDRFLELVRVAAGTSWAECGDARGESNLRISGGGRVVAMLSSPSGTTHAWSGDLRAFQDRRATFRGTMLVQQAATTAVDTVLTIQVVTDQDEAGVRQALQRAR